MMDSFFTTNTTNLAGDTFPMSFPSLDQSSTFFESFAPLQWPWITAPELPTSWDEPRRLSISTKQLDAFKFELTTPVQTPTTFHFEAESAEKEVTPEFIDMRDEKLAVLQELAGYWTDRDSSPEPEPLATPPQDIFDMTFTFAEPQYDPSCDTISWEELLGITPGELVKEPVTFFSSPSPPSFPKTPVMKRKAAPKINWVEEEYVDSGREDDKDEDYMPFGDVFSRRPFTRIQSGVRTPTDSSSEPDVTPKSKRKATQARDELWSPSKRQKCDPEVVCRVNGCRHISKTRFECFKHRETHFPGRFQCPYPECRKVFVRSSSLSRHLKRPRNASCGTFAGPQANWGVGLINFALCSPPWLEPGFLDDITEL